MNKFFFTITALVFVVTLSAQQRFKLGLNTGLTVSDINGANYNNLGNHFQKVGITSGLFVFTSVSSKNKWQFEINYTQKGTQQNPDSLNNGYYKLALDYVEIPVVFRHRMHFLVNKKPFERLELEVGASYGRLVRSRQVVDNHPLRVNTSLIKKNDISILFGLNYVFAPGFYMGIRYSNSLIPPVDKNDVPNWLLRQGINKGNHTVLQFTLRFVFGDDEKTATTPEVPTNKN